MATQNQSEALLRNITNGPSKFDLMLALFDNKFPYNRYVTFHIEGLSPNRVLEVPITIDMVGREDGSGESWIFEGVATITDDYSKKCHGYFGTRSRQGWIRFED